MMEKDNRFYEGQELKSIWWSHGGMVTVGKCTCKSIHVVMENGEMSGVPWALVVYDDGKQQKYNLKMCEGVEI